MRCRICDRVIDEPQFNSQHDDYEPCDTCLRVIEDTLASYDDVAAAPEDAWDDGWSEEDLLLLRNAVLEDEEGDEDD